MCVYTTIHWNILFLILDEDAEILGVNSEMPQVQDVSLSPHDIEDWEEVESSEGSQTLFSAVKNDSVGIEHELTSCCTLLSSY